MKTLPKIMLSFCAFFLLIGVTFIYQLNSDAFETYHVFEKRKPIALDMGMNFSALFDFYPSFLYNL